MKPVYLPAHRRNHPRLLMQDSILEAIRRGASGLRCPSGSSGWAVVATRIGMVHNRGKDLWDVTPQTMRAVVAYIVRRKAGKSPLAINDVYVMQRMTA